jgi:hypothetical protein
MLRFWSDPVIAPPVWLVRSADTEGSGREMLAVDLESILRWSPAATVAELAARLLVSEAEVRAGVAHAQEEGLLHGLRLPQRASAGRFVTCASPVLAGEAHVKRTGPVSRPCGTARSARWL